MPNVSRRRSDARFRRTWSSRWKRFKEWAKRLFLYGRLDWRRASDDATPLRLTAEERAALEPKFEVQAIRPRSVSAADLAPEPAAVAMTPRTLPTQPTAVPAAANGLAIDPSLLAAALSAVQQSQGGAISVDPAQVAAALEALQAAGVAPSTAPPASAATGVRSAEEVRAAERDHARRYKRRRRNRSSRAHIHPLTAFDSDNLPPSPLEAKVDKWFKR